MTRIDMRTLCVLTLAAASAASAVEPTPVERFYVADGLEATVWAQAPMFFNPTNMDTDPQGRIWVTEAVNYRSYNNMKNVELWRKEGDRVMVLEDSNGDGRADKSHMFVQDKDLVAPMGISVLDNKVYVTCSPNIIVYTDVNRDARFDAAVDKKEILLTGFGGFDHDHSLHTVKAGPDGDLYFTTGNAGPHIVTDRSGWTLRASSSYRGGSPYNNTNEAGQISDDGRMYVGGIAGRINPDGTQLRIIGHNFRNPYELALDSFGNVFQNDNDDTISCRATWLMEYGNLGFASADGERTWRADQRPGQTTPAAHWRQDDPGVIPSGNVYGPGSPTGVEFYENGALGPEYENRFLSCEAGGNLIWAFDPKSDGAGINLRASTLFSTHNPQESTEPMDTDDARKWFRPSDVLVGADGAVYVADFFDSFVGGHRMLEKEGNGVIYRITRKGDNPHPPALDIDKVAGQIQALKSPAHSVRYAGFQALTQKPSPAGVKALLTLSRDTNERLAARALYALSSIGEPSNSDRATRQQARRRVEEALDDANPNLRVTAYRALRDKDSEGLAQRAERFASDPSPAVRREVALSLRDLSLADSQSALLKLAKGFDGSDRWYLEAFGTACEGKEAAVWKLLAEDQPSDPLKWSDAFVGITWRLHPEMAVDSLSQRALAASLSPAQRRQALDALAFIPKASAGKAMLTAAVSGPQDLRSYAAWWVKSRSGNDWSAFDLVAQLPPDPAEKAAQEEARRMSQGRNKLKAAAALTDELRSIAIEMAGSATGGADLVHLAGRNELPEFFFPIVAAHIHNNPDLSVRTLATRYFPKPGAAGQSLPPIGDIANMAGDPEKGRVLYAGRGACATCHLHGTTGRDIGPNLTEVGNRFGKEAILDSIVNPSAAIAFGYEATTLETSDGKSYTGFIVGEGGTVIVKDIAGQQHSISQGNIRSRQSMDQSIMPPAAALGLSGQDLADLVAFLTE